MEGEDTKHHALHFVSLKFPLIDTLVLSIGQVTYEI